MPDPQRKKKTVEEQTKENDTWANHNNSEKSPSLMKSGKTVDHKES